MESGGIWEFSAFSRNFSVLKYALINSLLKKIAQRKKGGKSYLPSVPQFQYLQTDYAAMRIK